MAYKLQHKTNKNVIGVFSEIDEKTIHQLIKNNGSKVDDYEVIEFTPVAIMQPIPEPPKETDTEILIKLLKIKGLLSDKEIKENFKRLEG